MESNESETAAESPEDLTKKSQESDSTEKQTHIRFLVYEGLVGSVIGKGGSTITQFQENSGAQIQVSRNREYFPGTACRIVLIFGTTKQVLTALKLVLGKLHNERLAEGGSDVELRRTRIVVRHCSCGVIIGRGGATIRSFIEDSKAGIKISPLENNKFFGLSDRLVTLSGTMEDQMRAIDLILTKLTEDDDYSQQVHPGGLYNIVLGWRRLVKPPHKPLGSKQNNKEDNFNLVTIGVPDAHIGVVIGRGGGRIVATSVFSGARIKVSGRGGFIPGTTDRKVTISGSQGSIDIALSIIERNVDVSKRAYG